MNTHFQRFRFPIFLTALILASCNPDTDEGNEQSIGTTDVWLQTSDAGIEDLADEVTFRMDSDEVVLPTCVEVTDSGPGQFPRLITLDFGDGCTDAIGRTRTGIMHIALSAPWSEVGSTRSVTFENFTVTRPLMELAVGIEGIRELVRLEPGMEGEARWERTLNTTLTHPEFTVERTFSGVRRWIAGEGDPDGPQLFGLTGSGSHVRNGLTRSRTIIEEVVLNLSCGECVEGIVEIQRPIGEDALLDYGSGACDGTATLNVGGEVFEIDL